ncbi:hypothetical protein HBI69_134530 [Parastagonospora nodorum]|nr:hypothetical protein HBI69_134530 [Parastagonospora nodorum]
MSQTNVREGYRITTLEVVELIEDLISYLAVAKCTQLRNAQIPKVFHEAAVRQYGAKVKTEDLSNTLTPILSKTAQRRSSSVVSNRSTALITDKFGVASLTKPAILNDANVALVDAVHHSVVIDALTMTLIKDDDDLLGTVNSHIKLRRLRAVMLLCQTTKPPGDFNKVTFQPDEPPEQPSPPEQPLPPKKRADSRHAKASRRRTKKDKDLEDSDTSSDVPRPRRRDRAAARARLAERKQLGKEAQLKKTRDEEELAKAKKEKEEKEAQERETYSSDIDPKDDSEDKEATTAKDLAREQKERLKALLNAKTRDSLSARVGTAIEHCTLEEWTSAAVFFSLTDAYILYFKELLSDNGGIFANAIGMGKTRAIVLAVLMGHCDLSDPLALQFCFFSDSLPENIGRPTKEEAIEMRIDTTNAISKALAAANKLVAPQSYIIPEANTPAVHPKATKHRPAPSAARFVIVCGFRKVDKHVFRAYNTISVTAQRTIIRKGSPYIEKRGRTVFDEFYNCKSEGTIIAKFYQDIRNSVTSDRIYKIEDAVYRSIAEILSYRTRQNTALNGLAIAKQWRNMIANVKHDASEHESSYKYKELISQGAAVAQRFMLKRTLKTRDPWGKPISSIKGDFLPYFQSCLCPDFLSTVQNAEQQCRDILEKEGLNKLEASRRVIFNRFKMQAIASYPALATLKAAQFKTYSSRKVKRFTSNSVKDLFTNLSKNHFLVREARAITKSSLKFQNLSNLCSESIAAEDAAKAANTPPPPKEVRAKILIESYKPIVQARDPDRPWIIVALIAFAEAITLTEATHVVIIEPQDRQNTQDQFMF